MPHNKTWGKVIAVLFMMTMIAGCGVQANGHISSTNMARKRNTVITKVTTSPNAKSSFNSVSFIDSLRGWAEMGQTIFATTDGGHTWRRLAKGEGIGNIGFASKQFGWLFTGSKLKVTVDGGRTWHDQHIPHVTGIRLEQAQFVDKEHGWLMGAGQGAFIPNPNQPGSGEIPSVLVFWSTDNGGTTWTRLDVPTSIANHEFEGECAFSFVSPNQGFLVMGSQPGAGEQGKYLYQTLDGGRNWSLVTATEFNAAGPQNGLPGGGYIASLNFLNAKVGWLSESRGLTYLTTNGGYTWKALGGYRDDPMGDLHFLNQKFWYAIYHNTLLITHDGGSNWQQLYPGPWPTLFTETRFFNSRDGVSVGTLLDPGAILMTTDGGHKWIQTGDVSGDVIAFSFSDARHGWVITDTSNGAGLQRTIYRTSDGGFTWQKVIRTSEEKNLYASISFVNDLTGFVQSGWGHLFVTHNGGKTLQMVNGQDSDASNIQFITPVFGGEIMNRHLYSTIDGGKKWRILLSNYLTEEFDMVSKSEIAVIATKGAGMRSILMTTSNGGQTWTRYDFSKINPVGVVFSDSEQGWLVDDQNNYYYTTDGGSTWTQANSLAQ